MGRSSKKFININLKVITKINCQYYLYSFDICEMHIK